MHRSFGPTYRTPLYQLRTPPEEVGHTLLVLMRRGNLSATKEITSHKVDVFWSFAKKVCWT